MDFVELVSHIWNFIYSNRGSLLAVAGGVFTIWKTGKVEKSNQRQVNELQTSVSIQGALLDQANSEIARLKGEVERLSKELALAQQTVNDKDLLIIELRVKLDLAEKDLARATKEKEHCIEQLSIISSQQEGPGHPLRPGDTGLLLHP